MIPLKDNIRSKTFPAVTWALIILNALVFYYEWSLSTEALEGFIGTFGLVPANIDLANPMTWLPMFTHMFLHRGWVHVISNLWILFIFGDNVEDRLGSIPYLLLYVAGGLAAALLQLFLTREPNMPMVGASGAIAAVMGAYFRFYPNARVHTLIPIFIFPWFVEIPAIIYLGVWFVTQFTSGLASLGTVVGGAEGGVAFWAHVGGFVFGFLAAIVLNKCCRRRVQYKDEYFPW